MESILRRRMIKLTEEQKDIVSCDLARGEILKVMAFAGTGKTSTLIEYTKFRPRMRFLYVAFNKSVQLAASEKFPSNVVTKTSHALAFQAVGYKHKDRLVPKYRANTVLDVFGLKKFEDAKFTIDTLYNYLISAVPKVSKSHIPFQAASFYKQKKEPIPDFVDLANKLGRLMCDGSDERIGMLHDGYLKLYQLSNPKLNFDCILLDEAQDINPVTSEFIMAQARSMGNRKAASIILVGDRHQQIYSFRGAKNTLKTIKSTKTMYLTRSFRFDNNIARVANMVLSIFKDERKRLIGNPFDKLKKPAWNPKYYTAIGRTNASVFDKATQLYNIRKIGFVGGVEGYRLNIIRDVYYLFARKYNQISDKYIYSFNRYETLKSYAEAVDDFELLSVCRVVEAYNSRIPYLVQMISEKAVDAKDAEVVLTTAHKAKGLEWNNVLMLGDFPSFVEENKLIDSVDLEPDEFNICYVAMTRAISRLRFDKGSSLPNFIKIVQPQKKEGKAIIDKKRNHKHD